MESNKTVYEILEELNLDNSSNYKISTLKQYTDNELLKRVMRLALDKVKYNYGISKTTLDKLLHTVEYNSDYPLSYGLDILENKLATREVTGNAAIELIQTTLSHLSKEDADIIYRIISRDLKINMGRTNILKVFKDLITKQLYCRCGLYSKETAKKIDFKTGAFIQKKSDGTFKETSVSDDSVNIVSRSGEEYSMSKFESIFLNAPQGAYIGEMTVVLDDILLGKILPKLQKKNSEKASEIVEKYKNGIKTLDRATGNGLINSDDIPEDNIVYELWDFIPFSEYEKAASKDKKNPPKMNYSERLEVLKENLKVINNPQVILIETYTVYNQKEALEYVSNWMTSGFEGGVLKDSKMKFKDGTSLEQLKMKLSMELDLRITGFLPGNKGSKNENYFSAITFESDDGKISGQVGVTTFTEEERDWFFENKEKLTGDIMELQCNDLTQGSGKTTYALSHPRYIQMRTGEKTETDTLERAFEIRQMAMELV